MINHFLLCWFNFAKICSLSGESNFVFKTLDGTFYLTKSIIFTSFESLSSLYDLEYLQYETAAMRIIN